MAKTKVGRMQQTRWSASTDNVARADFDGDAALIDQYTMIFLEGTLAARPASGVTGRTYTVKGDATASNNGNQYYDNGATWIPVSKYMEAATVSAGVNTNKALIVRGVASQSANLQEWQDSASAVLASISATGVGTFKENVLGGTTGANVVTSSGTTRITSIFKAAASQSVDITQWQNSAGTVLAKVTNTGDVNGVNLTASAALSGATVSATTAAITTSLTTKTVYHNLDSATAVGVDVKQTQFQTMSPLILRDYTNVPLSRFTPAGKFVGKGAVLGDASITGATNEPSIAPTLYVQSLSATENALLLKGFSGQSAALLTGQSSAGATVFSVGADGGVSGNGRGYFAGGISNVSGTTLPLDITSGTATETFTDYSVIRHAATSASVASRSNKVLLTLGDAANQVAKGVAFGVRSDEANSASPYGQISVAGTDVVSVFQTGVSVEGTIDATGVVFNDVTGVKETFYSGYTSGVQTNTLYQRTGADIAWYKGGVHEATGPGTGGVTLASLNETAFTVKNDLVVPHEVKVGANLKLGDFLVERAAVAGNAYNSLYINSYNNTWTGSNVFIGTDAGGTTTIRNSLYLNKSYIDFGIYRLSLQTTAPSSPSAGDIWLDI